MPVGAQDDTVPVLRQPKLESIKENKLSKLVLCAAATTLPSGCDGSLPIPAESSERFVADGQFPSADGSRYNKFATDHYSGSHDAENQS
jgi:hypothetical protein